MYGTEPGFKQWFEQSPEVRKEIVLVTKDNPKAPKDMLAMLDKRLGRWASTPSTCSSSTASATSTNSTPP